jgi:prevent-host-death family protein
MSERIAEIEFGVAEAKARFSELIDRVGRGERFHITKHGRRVVELVRPGETPRAESERVGLAAVAGALAEWDDLPRVVEEIYRTRRRARDRHVAEVD